MILFSGFSVGSGRMVAARILCGRSAILAACTFAVSLSAQTPSPPPPDNASAPTAPEAPDRGRRGNFNPAEIQARMMAGLRERLAIKDDSEWSLVAERIGAVMDLRRKLSPNFAGRGFDGAGGPRGNRPNAQANPELEALRSAIADNLPDAEISARLAQLREARKHDEAAMQQAQEALRSVLTVRQEAVAVSAGLLQ